MSRPTVLSCFFVAAGLATMMAAPVRGHTYDKLTYMTFSGPVQVPGVTLNAGTYRFRLANPDTSRNVLQVLNHDGSTVYAMFHTIPDSRMNVTEESTVMFRETPVGVPPAVKTLFYGGERNGYEFVYPRGGPIMVAPFVLQPEITYSPMPSVAMPEPIFEPEPGPIENEPVAAPEPEPEPPLAELPRTASLLPLVSLSGLASLVLGLGVGLVRRRLT